MGRYIMKNTQSHNTLHKGEWERQGHPNWATSGIKDIIERHNVLLRCVMKCVLFLVCCSGCCPHDLCMVCNIEMLLVVDDRWMILHLVHSELEIQPPGWHSERFLDWMEPVDLVVDLRYKNEYNGERKRIIRHLLKQVGLQLLAC